MAKLKDLRIHDLRRTTGSYQAIAGVSLLVIGKTLVHKSHQSTAVYTRLSNRQNEKPSNKLKSIIKTACNVVKDRCSDRKVSRHKFEGFILGQEEDYNALSSNFGISVDGLLLAAEEGILKIFHHFINDRCWSVVDKNHFVRQVRRLDGQPFFLQDGRSTKSPAIGLPSFPIGLPTDKPVIMLVEGSSDLLAAYSLIQSENLLKDVVPAAMLGATNIIHGDALEHFRGKYIPGFADYDRAGIVGMTRWQRQLKSVATQFKIFDYHGLKRDDGERVKDVSDFLRVDSDQWEHDSDAPWPQTYIYRIPPRPAMRAFSLFVASVFHQFCC